ncbi:hypothetical protein BU24DRAFT_418030, partial [Aaosphaeria arxii CBS 175.79]
MVLLAGGFGAGCTVGVRVTRITNRLERHRESLCTVMGWNWLGWRTMRYDVSGGLWSESYCVDPKTWADGYCIHTWGYGSC